MTPFVVVWGCRITAECSRNGGWRGICMQVGYFKVDSVFRHPPLDQLGTGQSTLPVCGDRMGNSYLPPQPKEHGILPKLVRWSPLISVAPKDPKGLRIHIPRALQISLDCISTGGRSRETQSDDETSVLAYVLNFA